MIPYNIYIININATGSKPGCYTKIMLNLVSFLIGHIPLMKYSQSLGIPFKVVITTYFSSTMSPIASIYPFIWDNLMKYDCIVSPFWIFTPLGWFLKLIILLMLFPLNRFVRGSNISFGVFFDDTWGIKWSLMDLVMIILDFIMSFLFLDIASFPYGSLTSYLM